MTKPKTPCYGCTERLIGCHAGCERYRTYRKQLDAYNEEHKTILPAWTNMKKEKKNPKKLAKWID